jgi:putative peptidoglycan lipid II flippase
VNEVDTPAQRALDLAMLRGMVAVGLFSAVTGAARVVQDAVMAWRYGAGPAVDAFTFVLNLAGWPVAAALATLTTLLAPIHASLRSETPQAILRFCGELFGVVLIAALVSLPLAWWALSGIVGGPVGGLSVGTAAHALAGIPAIVALVPLGLVGALFAAWLVAHGRHELTLLEALPPLVLAAALLLMPGSVLYLGTTVGFAVQVVAMGLLLRGLGALPRPQLGLSSPTWRVFGRGATALLAGHLLFSMLPLVDPFFAARMDEGAVATLGFANRLVLGLQGLAGVALQRAGLPLLSGLIATTPAQARRAVQRWVLLAAAAGVLLGGLVALIADPMVALLFERGRFGVADREQVAVLLRFGLLQLPVFLAGLLLATALAGAHGAVDLAWIGVIGIAAKVLFSSLLAERYGSCGLLVATALMYAVTALLSWLALNRRLRLRERAMP